MKLGVAVGVAALISVGVGVVSVGSVATIVSFAVFSWSRVSWGCGRRRSSGRWSSEFWPMSSICGSFVRLWCWILALELCVPHSW